jgi:hypothetical protein
MPRYRTDDCEPDFKLLYFPIDQAACNRGNDVSLRANIRHPHDKVAGNNVDCQAIHGVRTSEAIRLPDRQLSR